MKSKFEAAILPESEFDGWESFVTGSPQGSIYSRASYLNVLCTTAGGSFRILACKRGDEIVGGIALYETSQKFGRAVTSRLLLYYNGIVLKEHSTKYPSMCSSRDLAIFSELIKSLDSSGYCRVSLQSRGGFTDARAFIDSGWSARPSYSYVVDLRDIETALSLVEQNQRRLVARCEDEGMSFAEDDDFDSFFSMHFDTHRRKNAPLYLPREQYRKYFEMLGSLGMVRLFQVRTKDGRSVAAQLTLTCKHPVCHTVCAAADEEFLKFGTTPFLRVKSFERLAELGYEANDLTDAALNPVTKFKSQLGGELKLNLVLSKIYSEKILRREWLNQARARIRGMFKGA